MMDTLFIVMPAYNEEGCIENTVREWYPKLSLGSEDSRLVIADCGSTDTTHEILLNLQKELPKLAILENTDKQHGPKLKALYDYAVSEGADYVFQTDSDGQTFPDELDAFWEMREKFDMVLGYRKERKDGEGRKFVEVVLCKMLRFYFGVKLLDSNAPFRLMNARSLKDVMSYIPSDFFLTNAVGSALYLKLGYTLEYREITFGTRLTGKTSINPVKIFKVGLKAIGDFGKIKKNYKARNGKPSKQ